MLGILLCGPVSMVYGVGIYEETEIKTDKNKKELEELKELYENLKKEKEPPKEEYLEQLLQELKSALNKGKKSGKVRRAEGKLVEIDKGAVHKVHERDVYIVYDSLTDKYVGKIEIEAIADAISIGESYEQKRVIYPGDIIKFRGQRRFMEIGLLYGVSKFEGARRYSGLGTTWKYNLRGGWAADFLLSFIEKVDDRSDLLYYSEEYDDEGYLRAKYKRTKYADLYKIYFCLGVKKYFLFPSMVSPFIGSGISLLGLEHDYSEKSEITTTGDKFKKNIFLPYFTAGVQLFSGQPLHVDIEARYFAGPKLNAEPEPIKIRPIIFCTSVSFAW